MMNTEEKEKIFGDLYDLECINFVKEYNEGRRALAYVRTFGCQQNEADSERIRGILSALGYEMADDYHGSDLIILNTCAVRELAEEKVFSLLGNFRAEKRKNPELIVGVVGCMGAIKECVDRLKRSFHFLSFTLGAGVMHKLPAVIRGVISEGGRIFVPSGERECVVEGIPIIRSEGHRAFVSIMYGCNNFCSYCIVPYTRGRERSRAAHRIISECRELVSMGVKDITLLGQNVNSYRAEIDFPTLLDRVASIEGDFTVNFMTSHPKDTTDALIEVMARHGGKIAPHFHLPLQSGSDRILADMNRKYTKDAFIDIAGRLKERIPDINMTTDVIVGYPSETEEDFLETLEVLRQVKFDAVYAFLYSARTGTRAALSTDTVDEAVKHERIKRLLSMQDDISKERSLSYVGTRQRVLVDSYSADRGVYNGRTVSGRLVHFSADFAKIGEFTNVLIDNANAFDLFGKKLDEVN